MFIEAPMSDKDYIVRLEKMLLYTFSQIEKSKTPEHNINWFVSEDAKNWYKDYKNKPPYVRIAEELEDNKFDSIYNSKE